jgi:hypothetical protein
LHCPDVKPADPDEYVDRAHMILGGERRLRGADHTIGKCSSVLSAHRSMNPVILAAHPSTDYTQRAHAREIIVMRHQGGGVDRQRACRLNGVCQLEAQ